MRLIQTLSLGLLACALVDTWLSFREPRRT